MDMYDNLENDEMDEEQDNTTPLSQRIQAGAPDEPPSTAEQKEAMGQVRSMQEILSDLRNREAINKYTAQDLDNAIRSAQQAYDEDATRNKWGAIMDIIGQGLIKYGAAKAGAGSIDVGNAFDYEGAQRRSRSAQQTALENAKQKYNIGEGTRKEALDLELQLARARERDAGKKPGLSWSQKNAILQEQALERERRAEERAQKKAEKSDEVRSINDEIRTAQSQVPAATKYAERLLAQPDLSAKDVRKFEREYPDLAGKAGINADEVALQLQDIETPGFFGRIAESIEERDARLEKQKQYDTNADGKLDDTEQKAARRQILMNQVRSIQERIRELEKRRNEVITGNSKVIPANNQTSQPVMIDMISPTGKPGKVPANKVADAEAKGFKRAK